MGIQVNPSFTLGMVNFMGICYLAITLIPPIKLPKMDNFHSFWQVNAVIIILTFDLNEQVSASFTILNEFLIALCVMFFYFMEMFCFGVRHQHINLLFLVFHSALKVLDYLVFLSEGAIKFVDPLHDFFLGYWLVGMIVVVSDGTVRVVIHFIG